MSKHSHISAIFDNAFQSRAGSPDVYMSMFLTVNFRLAALAQWSRSRAPDLLDPGSSPVTRLCFILFFLNFLNTFFSYILIFFSC